MTSIPSQLLGICDKEVYGLGIPPEGDLVVGHLASPSYLMYEICSVSVLLLG